MIRAHTRERGRWWADYLDHPGERDQVLVAAEDGRIGGFATARPSPDGDARLDQAEVAGLYVDPDAWGRGIGGALLGALLERLRAGGFTTATLWVLATNFPAWRFYEGRY